MFPYYTAQNFLFAELLHKFVYLEDIPHILFPLLSPFLLWLISKKLFKGYRSLIPVLIFILSPWGWYLSLANSFYIFIFFLILTIIYGIVLVRSDNKLLGSIFVTLASVIAVYSSALQLIFIPLSFAILIASKTVSFKNFKISILFFFILTLPLLFLINKNKSEFKSSLAREVKIFSDPGLLNSINRYQGAASQEGLRNLARVSENKYLFYSEYIVLKYISQLTPNVFFTPQYKLLGFSFSPPVLLGFIIPFVYGLYRLLQNPKARKYILVSTVLVVPSVLSNDLVSLNRLVLIFPVIIFIISFGLTCLYKLRGNKISKMFLTLTLILIVFQTAVAVNDIRFREMSRFSQYFGQKYELVEP